MLINLGLVGPKAKANAVTDGEQVNIPVPDANRPSKTGAKLFFNQSPSGWRAKFNRVKVALVSGGRRRIIRAYQ
jgi:hypothetical protein